MKFLADRLNSLLPVLKSCCIENECVFDGFKVLDCDYKNGDTLPDTSCSGWRELGKNEFWGSGKDSHCWLSRHIVLPQEMQCKAVSLYVATVPETSDNLREAQFIVYINGKIAHGVDPNHPYVTLESGSEYDVMVYAYTGWNSERHTFCCKAYVWDENCRKLYYDLLVPFEALSTLKETSTEYADILSRLNNAVNLIDLRIPKSEDFKKSVLVALDYLDREFYNGICGKSNVNVICIGHTHIDVAWLWPLKQTVEKAVRSFSTVIDMMKRYPEYKFMSSQAQLYKFVKEQSPDTYAEIKKMVKAGRWEVEGAMWVEADCNLSSGESLVRQIMFGKRFFKNEFGVDSRVLWLPDVFGYSAALPQILIKSGVDKFVTSKIGWNESNMMPYDSFIWHGIDSTGIYSHFLTAQDCDSNDIPHQTTTYNACLNASQVKGCWLRYQQKHLNNEVVLTFGHGDGGGGPTDGYMEYYARLKKGIPSIPNAVCSFAGDYLERAKQRVWADPKLPHWVGELYLEYHRGTYTSIAKNKRNNRKSEFLYQNTELFSSIDKYLTSSEYPQKKLNEGWETILLNQFHDIIPGSSIKAVYDNCDIQYAELQKNANGLLDKSLADIAGNIKTDGGILVFNPLSFKNSSTVTIDGKSIFVRGIPAKGYKVVKGDESLGTVSASEGRLENDFFVVEFDKDMCMSRLYDKRAEREVLREGERGNVLRAFEDFPRAYDAWEISVYYKEKMWEITDVQSTRIVNDGARSGIEIIRKFLNSTITQTVWLYGDIDRIDFDTKADWHEEHLLIKAAFPVEISADKASYDIQFGNLERPTHSNTSWDAAKFEVCAHKFADISEYGYGVSIMNDCKYGHDIHNGVISLSLLKCATHPNPEADKGTHSFVYSLHPHMAGFREGRTVQLAYDLNNPMHAMRLGKQNGTLTEEFSFVSCSAENVIVDTVKKAEDSDSTVIRMYECYNQRSKVRLDFGVPVKKAVLCDLMENDIEELMVNDNCISLPIKPYEIVTVKIN